MHAPAIPPSPPQEPVVFPVPEDHLTLEGRLHRGSQAWGAVLCHPHPLHGGNMHNKVIDSAMRAISSIHGSVLRFNFRGVGESQGSYGQGIDETRDLAGAIAFMTQQGLVAKGLLLVGFSFGTGVIARYMNQPTSHVPGVSVDGVVLIAPPLQHVQLPSFSVPNRWGLHLILGEQDQFCTPPQLTAYQAMFGSHAIRSRVVPQADHFFHGYLHEVVQFIQTVPSPF